MKLETAVLAGFTALAAGQDLRKKQVDINLYWIFGMIAGAVLVFRMWENQNIMWEKAAEGLLVFCRDWCCWDWERSAEEA